MYGILNCVFLFTISASSLCCFVPLNGFAEGPFRALILSIFSNTSPNLVFACIAFALHSIYFCFVSLALELGHQGFTSLCYVGFVSVTHGTGSSALDMPSANFIGQVTSATPRLLLVTDYAPLKVVFSSFVATHQSSAGWETTFLCAIPELRWGSCANVDQ